MRWGDEQNASLLRMKESGKTLSEIADVFGCSVKAVHEAHIRLRAKTLVAAGGTVGRRETRPQHTSITAEFFGDPLPGRSALDQMRAGQGNGVRVVSLATGAS